MNIANKLTTLRVCLIPVFVLILALPLDWGTTLLGGATIPNTQLVAAVIFIVASVTDYLDGYLARKYQLVTSFGEFFDPMADKLLVIAAFVLLISLQKVPAWAVIIIISRELLITGLRVLIAQHNGKVLAAALPGKIKTFSQMFAIIFYLLNDAGFVLLNIPFADLLLAVCVFFTLYSGAEYFYHSRFVFKDM